MKGEGRRPGAVTVRQLGRETAAVLARVREWDAPVIVTQRGVPVATIHPLDVNPWARRDRAEPSSGLGALGLAEERIDLEVGGYTTLRFNGYELTAFGRRVAESLQARDDAGPVAEALQTRDDAERMAEDDA